MNEKISELLSQLTLEEKAALCVGVNNWQTTAVERLGLPPITMSDGPHGIRRVRTVGDQKSLPATCFPTASLLAATWNKDLIYELGQALADECIALGVDILLGPGNNMKRTPLCGRNFEYFSEDPYLGGEMAASFINGVQSKGVGTSLKHFAANNQETQRMTIDAQIDERALHEIYLAGFERAVKKARPWTVMCSYNRLNGAHASQNEPLLTGILKKTWGYEGFVVSDWGAVHDRVASLEAGLDLEMPGPQNYRVKRVIEAVQNGELEAAALDAAVERLLRILFKALETPKGSRDLDPGDRRLSDDLVEEHHDLARRIAAEGMVLLKNEGNILPLGKVGKIAVIGTAAKQAHFQGGGSSHINPTRVDSPFEELQKAAGDAELIYATGDLMETGFDKDLIDIAARIAGEAELALLYIGLPPFKESEGYDRSDLDLSEQQIALIQAVADVQPRCVVILNNGAAIDMRSWIDKVPAVLEAWLMGQAGGGAIADVLFGKVNPSGRIAETFPLKLSDTPAHLNFPGENGKVHYGEGIYIGYRYYDAKEMDVLFPFGYGLSYTEFELTGMRLNRTTLPAGEGLEVQVDVKNVGAAAGQAVVQLYVHDRQSDLSRPMKELKGFGKVTVQPGETQTITIELDDRAFAYYHTAHSNWVIEPGMFEIWAGQSSAGPFLKTTLVIEGHPLPQVLTMDSTLREWLGHAEGANVLRETFAGMFSETTQVDGHSVSMVEAIEWAKDLPLETVLAFWGRDMGATPEEKVRQLLAKV